MVASTICKFFFHAFVLKQKVGPKIQAHSMRVSHLWATTYLNNQIEDKKGDSHVNYRVESHNGEVVLVPISDEEYFAHSAKCRKANPQEKVYEINATGNYNEVYDYLLRHPEVDAKAYKKQHLKMGYVLANVRDLEPGE